MSRSRWLLLVVSLALATLLGGGIWVWADWWFCLPATATAEYVGYEACVDCHQPETKLWTGSDHQRAMDHARDDTVLGDFHDCAFTQYGVTSKFFRRDGKFCVHTEGPDGKLADFEIKYVFGVFPLQQYLVEFPDGRVQCLPIAWDCVKKEWYHLYPGEKISCNDPLYWTRPLQNWNYMCAECHTTDLRKNYDLKTNTYHTTWREINVSCESCHGPGSLHVQLAEKKWFFWDRRIGYGLARLKVADNRVQIETCAPCHARRRIVYPDYRPGEPLLDYYLPELIDGPLYYADGQILDEDYEYGSFIQSKMYHNQVRCSDCHDPHSMRVKFAATDEATGRPKIVDNRLCGQCHLPVKYDTVQHHHHPDATKPGWLCVDCHMPVTRYMVVDPRRDHSLRVPRPDLTVPLGIPNACNRCHNDPAKEETPQWAVAKVEEWYGTKNEPPHFAYAIAAGRRGDPTAEKPLDALARRQDLSAMVRASAISLLSRYPNGWAAAVRGLDDPDGLVRATSVRALEGLPPGDLLSRLRPALHDPLRAVRIEAARELAASSRDQLPAADREAFDRALDEYLVGQRSLDDQPGAHLNMAVVDAQRGRLLKAEQQYQTALRLDPQFWQARNNLAMLHYDMSQKEAAAGEFRRILEQAAAQRIVAAKQAGDLDKVRRELAAAPPSSAEAARLQARLLAVQARTQEVQDLDSCLANAHYDLGLLLAEEEKLPEAAEQLAAAVKLAPQRARIHYNYSLALEKLGRMDEAEQELLRAYELEPLMPDYLYQLTRLYTQQKRWAKALPCAEEIVRRQPENPDAQRLLQFIRQQAGTAP